MSLASRLRHTITIERRVTGTRNERGNPKAGTWSTLATVRGWYQPKSRSERDESSSGGAVGESGTVFMMPTDVTEADRLVIDGETYGIEEVIDVAGKGQHYEVTVHIGEAGS